MIVGITGPIASGKTVFSSMLSERGFIRLTISDEVRNEANKRGIVIERRALQDLGNELRKKHGAGYWAQRLMNRMEPGKRYVIEGIRNPGEVHALRALRNFVLVGVSAPVEQRLKLILARNKDSDPKTLSEIKSIDARDRGIGEDAIGQQSEACFSMADAYIINDSSINDLKMKAEDLAYRLGLF